LRVEDVAPYGHAADRATPRQKKNRPAGQVEMTEQTREAIDTYIAAGKKSQWIAGIGLDPRFFRTHSLRRTKATLIYRRTGNLRAVQLLLGHKKIESTVRYLGIEVDDALAIAEQVDV
jgi:integrase